jgi:hypothetical protein
VVPSLDCRPALPSVALPVPVAGSSQDCHLAAWEKEAVPRADCLAVAPVECPVLRVALVVAHLDY